MDIADKTFEKKDVITEHVDRCTLVEFFRRQGHWAAWYEDPEGSPFCICSNAGSAPRFVGYLYGYYFNRPLDGPRHAALIQRIASQHPLA